MIEQFINGPESPFKIKDEIEKITEEVCQGEETTGTHTSTQLMLSTSRWKSSRPTNKLSP